jgi:Tol biopolymer transport system component
VRRPLAVALAVLALGSLPASAGGTSDRAGGSWIVLGSNRDGSLRAYSMRPDGSRVTPLLAPGLALEPVALSGDGGTTLYTDSRFSAIYVSRADGTRLHRLPDGDWPALSRNGKLVAFARAGAIWIEGANGGGLRRLAAGEIQDRPAWSPDGKALAFVTWKGDRSAVVVQQLSGKRRVLAQSARLGESVVSPRWSPDGRSIAYDREGRGLWVVHLDGSGRHRVARGEVYPFAWSPDGKRIAFANNHAGEVALVRPNGRGLRRLTRRLPGRIAVVSWSPDGRRLALESGLRLVLDDRRSEIWIIGADGRGLRRVASTGLNELAGWTRLAPVRPPAPPLLPSERVLGARTVMTRRPISDLSADGARVAFSVGSTSVDCDHVVVWTPAKKKLVRFRRAAPCESGNSAGEIYDVELAGSRAAWTSIASCGNYCEVVLETATLARRSPIGLASDAFLNVDTPVDFHVHGDRDLLVFDDGSRLERVGIGGEPCAEHSDYDARICTTLRRGNHAAGVESVSGSLIAVREPDAVAVVDGRGKLVRVFPFGAGEITTARLDGGRLFVASEGLLAAYDVSTGAALNQRSLPRGFELRDVDGGIAVLQSGSRLMLLRLADRRSFTLTLRGRVFSDLEPDGLYYSYGTAGGGGRVVLMPRSEVARKLGGSARALAAARSSWIVLGSDRDGQVRPYGVRPDGSRLTLLQPPTSASLTPVLVSRNGAVVVYEESPTGDIYASRGSGAGLRKLRPRGLPGALSRDGKLLAYEDDGIWIVGTDGRGRRRLSSSSWEHASGWSPAGDALLVATEGRRGDKPQKPALWIQPLRGRRRLLARGAGDGAWSPDGRWIAYHLGGDLWAVQPDGRRRHRVARGIAEFDWSPDSRRLAFTTGKDIVIVGVDARRLRTIRVRGVLFLVSASWSPDGRRLAFESASDDGRQVGVVGVDGRGLRRVASLGDNTLAGWTPFAPVAAGGAAAPERTCLRGRFGRGPATDPRPVRRRLAGGVRRRADGGRLLPRRRLDAGGAYPRPIPAACAV